VAGVKAGCVHLCRVAGNTVWSIYGKWRPVALRLLNAIRTFNLFYSWKARNKKWKL